MHTIFVGETIEVLDIGLRNPRNCNAVHRVKPSESSQQFHASLSTSKGMWGKSNSTFALSTLGTEEENGAFAKRGSAGVGYSLYNPSPRGRSSSMSNQETYGRDHPGFHERLPHMYGGYPRMTNASIDSDLQERGRYSGSSSNSSVPSPSHSTAPLIPGKIPPPHIMKRWREMSNGHFPNGGSHEDSGSVRGEGEYRRRRGNKEANLRRSGAFRTQKIASEGDVRAVWRGRRESEDGSKRGNWRIVRDDENGQLPSVPLKHSRHYRKIELQAEKPLIERDNDEDSSDDEMNSIVSESTGKSSPGVVPTSSVAKMFHGRDLYHSPLATLEEHGRKRNYSGPPISGRSVGSGYPSFWSRERLEKGHLGGSGGRSWTGSGTRLGNGSPFGDEAGKDLPRRPNFLGGSDGGRWTGSGTRLGDEAGKDLPRRPNFLGGSDGGRWTGSGSRLENGSPFGDEAGIDLPRRPNFLSRFPPSASESTPKYYSLESLEKQLQEERDGNYCKVTVGMRNENAVSGITSRSTGISNEKLDNILRKSQHSSVHSLDYNTQLPSPVSSSTYEDEICEENHFSDNFVQLSPPLSPLEDFELPARESESFLYRSSGSMKSPVDDIIAPPLSFDDIHITPSNGTISEEEEPQSNRNRNEPQNSKSSGEATDRNSTESYSSGYTSGQGQSPGISEMMNLTTVDEFSGSDLPSPITNEMKSPSPVRQDTLSELSSSISSAPNSHTGYSTRHSQTSYASTDSIRFYVPFVFQKSRISPRRAITPSKTSLLLVVCLVENSDNLIKVRQIHTVLSLIGILYIRVSAFLWFNFRYTCHSVLTTI